MPLKISGGELHSCHPQMPVSNRIPAKNFTSRNRTPKNPREASGERNYVAPRERTSVRRRHRRTDCERTVHHRRRFGRMMKQPVENVNATPEEIEAALARAVPIVHDSPVITQEVAKLAYQYWTEREGIG